MTSPNTGDIAEERARRRKRRALELFDETFLLAPTEREQRLNLAYRQDPQLRALLDDLLLASRDAEPHGALEVPTWIFQPIEPDPLRIIGQRVGAYRLTLYVSKGGMGLVYLGERVDGMFRRRVAIKFTNDRAGGQLYARFRREVQVLADLQHPNLVTLYDAGRLEDGRLYIVMEYLDGQTLEKWAKNRVPVPAASVVEIIKQAGAGLHAAHRAGVIHRDIKPSNISILDNDGKLFVKVFDFGIAARKQHAGSGVNTTQKGLIGTLLYMSPEQVKPTKGKDLTPASDVYALGLIAYELVTGSPANDGQSEAEILTNHLRETPPPPSLKRPGLNLPPGFDHAVMKALAKDPAQRYQSAPEFTAALEASFNQRTLLQEVPTQAPSLYRQSSLPRYATATEPPPRTTLRELPPPPTQASSPRSSPRSAPVTNAVPTQQTAQISNRNRAVQILIAVALPALILVAAVLVPRWWQSQTQPQPPLMQQKSPSAVVPEKRLKLFVKVRNEAGAPLAGSSIAVFHSGITAPPAEISESNAVILRTDAQGLAETPSAEVTEGSYLMKIVRAGYKSRVETVKLTEDQTRPGAVSLLITLSVG